MATTVKPWLNDISSNRYIQTYMRGYLDISGGPLILRNAGVLGLSGDSSFNNNVTVGGRLVVGRLVVGKSLNPVNAFVLDVSGPMNFGGSDSSFGGNVTVNNNLAMGGLIQQNVSSNNTFNQQMISVPYSAFVGSGFSYLGSPNTFTGVNTFTADASFSRLFTSTGSDASLGGNLFVNSYTTFNNDVSANAELLVGGDASLNGRLFVAADVSMNKRLYVGGDASLGGNFFVNGLTTFNNDVSANAEWLVGGDASLNGRLFVAADVSMNRRLFLGGDVSLSGRLFVTSDISANSRLFVNSDVSLGGNLFVASDVSMKRLFLGGDASLGGRLFVSNGLTITDATSVMPSATYGTLTLQHADPSGCSSILFKSNTTASVQPGSASDYASIAYYDSISGGILATAAGQKFNYNYYGDASSTSSSALVINVQANPYKIGTGVDVSFMDNLILQPAGSCIIDACGSTLGQTIIQPRGGNVGINTTTPAYSLDVNGTLNVNTSASITNLTFTSASTAMPGFSSYKEGTTTVGAIANGAYPFAPTATTSWTIGGGSFTNGVYTVPTSGYYIITFMLGAPSTYYDVSIFVNTARSQYLGISNIKGPPGNYSGSTILSLSSGNTIQLYAGTASVSCSQYQFSAMMIRSL